MNDAKPPLHIRELNRYNHLPKQFVSAHKADELFLTYERLSKIGRSSTYLYTAGSAAAESGLMAIDKSPDERHFRIECAADIWQEAQLTHINKHMFDGWSEAKLYAAPNRIEMHRIFVPLYHDMIDGAVREETMDQIHELLVRLGVENLRQHDSEAARRDGSISVRRGLGYELGSLMSITRLRCPSFFAIPATARADHGLAYPEDTHDGRLIRQSWGTIEECIPFEVKPNDGTYRDRYKSAFIRGRVELSIPESTNPLALASYLHREQTGTADASELAILNEITSRVLRQSEDCSNAFRIGQVATRRSA